MGCGTPLVVTRTGGPDKFAMGKIVEKENPEQLAKAILDILALPPDEHRALSKVAHRKVHKFSWRSIVEKRLELYEEVRKVTPASWIH